MGAVILFDITKDGNVQQSWSKLTFIEWRNISISFFLAIDGKKGTITEGKPQDGTAAQVTIIVDDDDFADLAAGKANAPAVCFQWSFFKVGWSRYF